MLRRQNARLLIATATAAALTGGLLGLTAETANAANAAPAAPGQRPGPAGVTDDVNGDGFRDYITGGTLRSQDHVRGTVTVTHGTANGPGRETATFDQNSPGIPGEAVRFDQFGTGLATADFNSDGYADVAVSDPSEPVPAEPAGNAWGMVLIMWGSRSGLGTTATELPYRPSPPSSYFGGSLAAGDFDGDGRPDLAVTDQHSVHIQRGGFTPEGPGTGKVTRHSPNHDDLNTIGRLVAGKVTKDRATDLYALGSGLTDNDARTAGAWFLRGGSTIKPERKPLVYGEFSPEWGHWNSGVIADFDRDGYGDLAVTDIEYGRGVGAVAVRRGGAGGPTSTYRITPDTPGIAGQSHAGFGASISAGDVNRDGYPDLAVGAPGAKVNGVERAGGVHVVHGGQHRLSGIRSRWFTRASVSVPGDPEQSDYLGNAVRLLDMDRDGDADLLASGRHTAKGGLLLNGGGTGITPRFSRDIALHADFQQ
ncbi:FG-GAP and VCBS repeat-containing protein [Streptomyces sp. NPDC001985]|uniref:FG-GAP and VCBS repeat-containing protein n=1 Tax=Streptomyces sp. NPDC001985 TaxID=3154406 RepID=UPI0033245D78